VPVGEPFIKGYLAARLVKSLAAVASQGDHLWLNGLLPHKTRICTGWLWMAKYVPNMLSNSDTTNNHQPKLHIITGNLQQLLAFSWLLSS